jgi:cytochrome P450
VPAIAHTIVRAVRMAGRAATLLALQCSGALGLSPPLPPGSLGPRAIARFGGESFYVDAFRRYGPVFKVLWNRNLAVCVVGFDRARRVLAIHGQALAQLTIDITPLVPKGFLRGMRRDDHHDYRALIVGAMRHDLASGCEAELRDLIRLELTQLAQQASQGIDSGHPVLTPRLHRLATRALLLAFFGQRSGNGTFDEFESGFDALSANGVVVHIGEPQRRAFARLRAAVQMEIERRRHSPPPASTSVLDHLAAHANPRAVDETMIGNLIYMVELGRYDIRSLLRWLVKHLSDHPDVVVSMSSSLPDRIETDEARTPLAHASVLETLRLEQIDALNRSVVEEFEFEGLRIPAGAALRVLLRESHRDPSVFAAPDEYRPCRFAAASPPSRHYAPFGFGEHRCVAAQFVVAFATMFVEELVGGYTWTVARDGPIEKLSHAWEPAASFEIACVGRQA